MGCTSSAAAQQKLPKVSAKTLLETKRRPSLENKQLKIQVVADTVRESGREEHIHGFGYETPQVSAAATWEHVHGFGPFGDEKPQESAPAAYEHMHGFDVVKLQVVTAATDPCSPTLSDEELLDLAYQSDSCLYYDKATQTLAIAGTSSIGDVLVDATLPLITPLGSALELTPRYQDALDAFERLKPKHVIGHSLGGQIASTLASRFPEFQGTFRLYGAPRITWTEKDTRVTSFRHFGDLVSILDRAAEDTFFLGNPHSTDGFKDSL